MRRYWIEKNQVYQNEVSFKGDQFHHIFDVCRQEVGHHFEVITEDSKAYLVEVKTVLKKEAVARIIEERIIPPLPKPHVHLAMSLPRYNVMDSTIERAVELGVTSILPFVSAYSFIRKEKELPAGKYERWQKIVVSATQQSGRGELMKISQLSNWQSMLQTINPNKQNWCLFAYEGQHNGQPTKPIADEIKSMKQLYLSPENQQPENIWIIVGSEGGFSEQEAQEMHKLGLHPVTLGSQILRVETACLTLVSVLKYEFGLMK
ncbi:MAG: RsmE family RNA methyltransferase [Pseudobdellovibrio sp.]